MRKLTSAALASAVATCFTMSLAHSAELVVYGSVAAKAALAQIVPAFEHATGNQVTLRYGTTGELQDAIARGATIDVAILTRPALDDLAGKGKLDGSTLRMVAKSGIGVAVRKGAALPAIGTGDDFKRSMLDARSIAYTPQGATGVQLQKIFARLYITDALQAKTVLIQKGTAPEAVGRGEADVALTQMSEILTTPAAQLVGPLPAEIQAYSLFGAALGSDSTHQDAARAFMTALTSPAAKAILAASGLEPD